MVRADGQTLFSVHVQELKETGGRRAVGQELLSMTFWREGGIVFHIIGVQ